MRVHTLVLALSAMSLSAGLLPADEVVAPGGPSLVTPRVPPPPAPGIPPREVTIHEQAPMPAELAPPAIPSPSSVVPEEQPPEISPYVERWRYVNHAGQWWYYQPTGRWSYWSDGRWVELPAKKITRRTVAAARPPEYPAPPQTYVVRPARVIVEPQPRMSIGVGVGAPYYGYPYGPYPYGLGPYGYYGPRYYPRPVVGIGVY